MVVIFAVLLVGCFPLSSLLEDEVPDDNFIPSSGPGWVHLSSVNGDLPEPSGSTEQTASLLLDIDKDGIDDIVIGARRDPGPSLVWYQRADSGWKKHIIDGEVLKIEAGGAYHDIDGDGDLDVVMGGDAGSNKVWWWENP